MTRPFLVSLAGVAALAAFLAAQSPSAPAAPQAPPPGGQAPPTPPPVIYTVDVSLVEVDASVTDGDGRIVRDLRREDFQIFEDGKPQTIDRLSFVEIPIERAVHPPDTPAAADVSSNVQRFDGRLYVLLLDDLHTAAPRSERVRSAARRFVEQSLQAGDLAAVVHVSGSGGASQDFTADRERLLASIERFAGRKLQSEALNRVEEYNRQRLFSGRVPEQVTDLDEGARADAARHVFGTIAGIAARLAPVRGRRKALLWFGEGVAYDMFDLGGRRQASLVLENSRAAVAAASRANLAIYGVDARGLAGLGEEAVQLTSPAEDPTGNLGASGLSQELLRSQENLRRLSNDTGGFAVVNTGEFAHAFERVVHENSAYYLLGYYPSNERQDGTFRRIEVRVTRPGVSVRARSGYVAVRPKTDPTRMELPSGVAALRDALASPVPHSALPMSVHLAPFRGTGGKASVLVTVEYAPAAFASSGTVAPGRSRLDTSVIAMSPTGKLEADDHSTIPLNVKPETSQAMQVLGFRTHSRLELLPGRYRIRAAAFVAGSGLVGSVHEDLEVPDFSDRSLTMSGLVLTSVVAGYTPTARLDDRMREVLPAPPTTTRDFRSDEAIALFAELYENGGVPAGDVLLKTQVRSEAGRIIFEREDVRTADQMKQSGSGYPLQVSLRQFAAGDYVLRLEAQSRTAASRPVVREVAFQVWEVPPSGTAPEAAAPSASLPVVAVAHGPIGNVAEPRQVVARTDAEWQALWRSLSLRGAAPAVTFDNTMIVAVFLGSRPTAGYEPQIVALRREADVLVVEWREQTPRDAGNPPNQTTPFVVAGVPQHPGEVRFRKVP